MDLLQRLIAWCQEAFSEPPDTDLDGDAYPEDLAAPTPVRALRPMETLICTPREFKDARYAVQSLNDKKVVLVRLIDVDEDTAQRIIDFISGAVYLLHGSMQLFGETVLLCTPEDVRVEREDFALPIGTMPVFRGLDR